MKWLKRFFTKSEIREVSFYTGTDGMKKHSEFIDWVNENDVEIINSYMHLPQVRLFTYTTLHKLCN